MLLLGAACFQVQAAPDFKQIRSDREAARSAANLVRVLLVPVELGGEQDFDNHAYITPAAARAKAEIDAMLAPLAARREIDYYQARTRFKGASVVPSEILISVVGPKRMQYRIKVW